MNQKIRNLTYIGLMTAMIAVISVWQIPLPLFGVAMTFQTFAVALSGYVLKGWRGVLSTLAYIMLGAVGLPVFSGFQGGFSVLFGLSGGYIFGFLPLSLLCGINKGKKAVFSLFTGLVGLVLCHVMGVVQFCIVTDNPVGFSFLSASLPYIPKDVLSIVGAYLLSRIFEKRIMRR